MAEDGGVHRKIPTCCNVCPWLLLIVMAKSNQRGNWVHFITKGSSSLSVNILILGTVKIEPMWDSVMIFNSTTFERGLDIVMAYTKGVSHLFFENPSFYDYFQIITYHKSNNFIAFFPTFHSLFFPNNCAHLLHFFNGGSKAEVGLGVVAIKGNPFLQSKSILKDR